MFSGRTCVLILLISAVIAVSYVWYNNKTSSAHPNTNPGGTSTKALAMEETYINVHVKKGGDLAQVFYRKLDPLIKGDINSPSKIDVLLLHGMKFSSKTWKDLHTINILAENGHRVVAVDLPGYGNSERIAKLEEDNDAGANARVEFMSNLIEALGLDKPAIVSPSMSGSFSLPLVLLRTSVVGAFIPVAPVHTEKFSSEQYMGVRVPTLIVYGEYDKRLGLVSLHNLSYLPVHEVLVLPEASHPAYLDQPKMWHEKLKSFLDSLKT